MQLNLFALSGGNIADIVAIAIFALCVIIGVAKGFTKSLLKSAKKIISLILAFVLCGKVAILLDGWFHIIDGVSGPVASLLERLFGVEIMNTPFNEAVTADNITIVTLVNLIKNALGESTTSAATLQELLCPIFSYYIASIISFILLYIVFRIAFSILTKVLTSVIEKITVLKIIDKVLGLALGLINGFIIISVALLILSLLPFGFMTEVNTAIAESTVISKISEINLFSLILQLINNSEFLRGLLNGLIGGGA